MILRPAFYDARRCVSILPLARSSVRHCRTPPRNAMVSSCNTYIGTRRWNSRFSQGSVLSTSTSVKLKPQDAKFDALMWKLQVGLTERKLRTIRESYKTFVENERQTKPISYTPRLRQKEVILATVDFLTDAGQLDMLDVVLDLMHTRCGMVVDRKLHQSIVERFQEKGNLRYVFTWLTQMRHKPGNVVPTVEMWNLFIRKCRRNKVPVEFFRKPVACVRMSGCEPNEETYQAILEALFNDQTVVPPTEDVKGVLEEMEKAGCLNRTVIDGLVHAYSRTKVYEAVSQLESILQRLGEEFIPMETHINTAIAETLLNGTEKETTKLLRDFVKGGFQPSVSTLAVMAPAIANIRSLVYWENILGVRANTEVLETVINNASNSDNRISMELYRTALARGHRPTASMLLPILRNMCSAKWGPASTATLDKALHLLRQYVDITAQTDNPPESQPSNSQNDLPLYNIVLRALISSADSTQHLATATSLLTEIRMRDITMDCMTRTSFIILTMRCASSPQEALDVYNVMKQTTSGQPALDSKGYTAVLGQFTKNFLKEPSAFSHCMSILNDMRAAGHHMTVETFTIVLRQLALLATDVPATNVDAHERIASAIRRIHNHISVEASFTPDTVLWNQLMDTYQRAGCFRDAYKVWETMYISNEFDYASVSIVWDACAFAGAYGTAKEIFLKLQRKGFVFNERNWLNWVECLCRLGRIEDATKVVCLQLPEEAKIKPTVDHAKILLRFAAKWNQEHLVRDRLKRYLPNLYAKLY